METDQKRVNSKEEERTEERRTETTPQRRWCCSFPHGLPEAVRSSPALPGWHRVQQALPFLPGSSCQFSAACPDLLLPQILSASDLFTHFPRSHHLTKCRFHIQHCLPGHDLYLPLIVWVRLPSQMMPALPHMLSSFQALSLPWSYCKLFLAHAHMLAPYLGR